MTSHVGIRAIGLFVVAAVGCGSEEVAVERNVDASSWPIRAAVRSNVSIADKLAGALADEPGNMFYSPLSIEAVTGILFAGAAGNTAAQLSGVLDAEGDPAVLHEGLGALLKDLRREHSQYTLSLANRLWASPEIESSPAFGDTLREQYDAPIVQLDFASDPTAALSQINGWVSDQTASKIPMLLKPTEISGNTVLAIVNAIYFKADWAKAFDPSLTRSGSFYRADGSEVTVEMMSMQKSKLRTKFYEGARWLELPYRTGDVSFLVYTRENEGAVITSVQALQEELADVDLTEVVDSLEEREVVVQMPRFSMRSRIELIPVFKELGVTDLFEEGRANLANISRGGGLAIDLFVHEAAIWVDEQGTVAVAATVAGATRLGGSQPLRLDRPFLFMIRDNLTGAILFAGRVADPSVTAD
jgi:serpin B